jgi:hypothetical protein
LPPESWRGLLVDPARAGPETVEITKSADSGTNSAAVDPAGIQAKLNLISETAGSNPQAAPDAIDATRRSTPGCAVEESACPGARRANDAAGGVADTLTQAVGPSADTAGSNNQRHVLAVPARAEANTRSSNAPAPIDDWGRICVRNTNAAWRLGMSKGRGTASEGRRQGQSQSTPHLFLRMIGWLCCVTADNQ